MYKEPNISSSYKKVPVFGQFLYDYVMKHKPKVIVEFGCRQAYSTICMAQALRDLGEGHLYAHDSLKEGGAIQLARIYDHISDYRLDKYITFKVEDFYDWAKSPTPFDLLHVDIDNNGDTIRFLREKFKGKHVIFEGGIPLRDDEAHLPPIVGSAPYKVLVWDYPGLSKLK